MAIIEIDDLAYIPPSVFREDAARLFAQVNGDSQQRDLADLAAATSLSQSFKMEHFGG